MALDDNLPHKVSHFGVLFSTFVINQALNDFTGKVAWSDLCLPWLLLMTLVGPVIHFFLFHSVGKQHYQESRNPVRRLLLHQ